jgi:hypothetical protein
VSAPGHCHYRRDCWLGDVCMTTTANENPRPPCFRQGDKKRREAEKVQEVPTNAAEYREGELF